MQRKIVYVIGAGASNDAELPVGQQFKRKISSLTPKIKEDSDGYRVVTSGDQDISGAATRLYKNSQQEMSKFREAGQRIGFGVEQAVSIDNFLDHHRENEYIELYGKLAIVKAILLAEAGSKMYFDPSLVNGRMNFRTLEETWYTPFMQHLIGGCQLSELKDRFENIALIIFNYDRCVEHYMDHWLRNYFGIDADRSNEILSSIKIYHPYGSVGGLLKHQADPMVPFGANPNFQVLLNVVPGIRTFTEGTDPESSKILEIRKWIAESNVIVFLGFGFLSLNMDLILPEEPPKQNYEKRIYGSARGISEPNCEVIVTQFANKLSIAKSYVKIFPSLNSCRSVFDEYSRYIAPY